MGRLDRRAFLRLLSAAGGALAFRAEALRVDAEATVFYSQPDAQRVLVRFFVSGANAPGGRLRVFDRAGRQVGTAGVIPLGDGRLYGELWVPLAGPERLESELVVPGRPPFRSSHALAPQPRWRLYWTTVVPPAELRERIRGLSPLHRSAQVGLWAGAGLTINPLPASLDAHLIDHLPFLHLGRPALDLEWELGLPRNPVALVSAPARDHPALPLVLRGSGVQYAASPGVVEPHWLSGPDGSRVLVAPTHPGSRPTDLGFAEGSAEALRRVERWIATLPTPTGSEGAALIAGTTEEDARPEIVTAAREWNSRLAFPQILVGSAGEYFRILERRGSIRAAPEPGIGPEIVPTRASELAALARARDLERTRRADAMTEALGGLAALARQVGYGLPGTLVFNSSPFTRTGLVRLSDGSERVVTDVPAIGYAFVPQGVGEGPRWRPAPGGAAPATLENPHVRLTLDEQTGALRSLVSLPDGTEWARAGGAGLNAVAAARVERVTRLELPGAAARLVIDRWSPGRGALRTTLTIYDGIPRVDIINSAEAVGDGALPYQFAWPMEGAWVEWEVPAGARRARAPAGPFGALRWIRLSGPPGSVLVSSLDAPFASIDPSGDLTIPGPRGEARISLGLRPATRYPPRDDPWHFGWNSEPLRTAPVGREATQGLPSFGSLIRLDEPGILVLGVEPRGAGRVLLHVQELFGVARRFRLREGVLAFAEARRADLLGVPDETLPRDGDAVTVSLPANGVVAVSLHGVTLRRA